MSLHCSAALLSAAADAVLPPTLLAAGQYNSIGNTYLGNNWVIPRYYI